jgi:hypothetical protein
MVDQDRGLWATTEKEEDADSEVPVRSWGSRADFRDKSTRIVWQIGLVHAKNGNWSKVIWTCSW